MFKLPASVEACGVEYAVRSDYRAILEICVALTDIELSNDEKAIVALMIFYPAFDDMPQEHYQDAINECFWFIRCGDDDNRPPSPKLVDWEQDFAHIVAPINRVTGTEIRSTEYMHWWTFIAAYNEIGDCTFAQIVRVRDKLARGKTLDKSDREWYRKNKHMVDFKNNYTDAESNALKLWTGEK